MQIVGGADTADTKVVDDHPDSEGAEAPAKWDSPVFELGVIDAIAGVRRQVLAGRGVDMLELLAVVHPQEARVKPAEEPLGTVKVERGGDPLKILGPGLELGEQPTGARVCGVDMHPEIVSLATSSNAPIGSLELVLVVP